MEGDADYDIADELVDDQDDDYDTDILDQDVAAEEEEQIDVDWAKMEDMCTGAPTFSFKRVKKVVDWSSYELTAMDDADKGDGLLLQIIDIEDQKRRLPNIGLDDPTLHRDVKNRYMPTVPCVRLYCKDKKGFSVCVNVYGFYPVVRLLASVNVESDRALQELQEYVEKALIENESNSPFPKKRPPGWRAILTATRVQGFPAFPYVDAPYTFIEFKLADSCYITAFGRLMRRNGGELESSFLGDVRVLPYSCHNIVDKFQADMGISGFGWIHVKEYKNTDLNAGGDDTRCHLEVDTCIRHIKAVKNCDDIAPIRKITFDIECLKTRGMPKPETDSVIVISAICGDYVNGQPDKKRKVLLQLGQADQVKNIIAENGDVHACFDKEKDMLDSFGQLVDAFDPDYLCGHNIIGFDLPFLVTRAETIDADDLRFMGRRRAYKWIKPRRVVKKRKSGETRETMLTSTPGRIQLDTLNWIMGGFEKERSYKLAYLAAKYLNDTKDDVGYSMIGPMWRHSNATRARLSKYCLKDSELTEGLCDLGRYQMVISSIEMSRQTRVPAAKLLRSGVQVKVWGLLLEKANNPNFDDNGTRVFFPDEEVKERGKDDKFAGAEVLEPHRGYYEDWVGCGDFRSLYPSIIIDLNICYTTELTSRTRDLFPNKKSPIGTPFIDKKKRAGLLPQIEVELMAARDYAKKQVKEAKDPGSKIMYDKRQNEIKIICNSVYGIMSASGGRLTRMELGESVTSQGRLMIMTAKDIAESLLEKINHEKKADPFKVIYGDTDSIFILFPKWISSKEDVFKWLNVICDTVTKYFSTMEAGSPIMLQAEKAMKNGILINKKRYIFTKYEGVNDKGKILAKGVETARRDNCLMVVDCMETIMQKIFIEGDKDGAVAHLNTVLKDLMAGNVDIGKLLISKAISKDHYKNKPPHLAVAQKMQARDPSYEAGPAERIPFVIVSNGGKNVTESAEDPLWTIKKQIPLDISYYINNQLAGPVARILMWIFGSAQDMHTVTKCENRYREVQDDPKRGNIKYAHDEFIKSIKTLQKNTVTRFFGPGALSAFPRKTQSTSGKAGAIDSFFKKTAVVKRCLHGNDRSKCKECTGQCDKCDAYLDYGQEICQCSGSKCAKCERYFKSVDDKSLCPFCAAKMCCMCFTLLDKDDAATMCKRCHTVDSMRKKYKVPRKESTPDIEDLIKQATEAKLKCDKCRGYADETEIKCVQKDCLNLYRRATIEIKIKNLIH